MTGTDLAQTFSIPLVLTVALAGAAGSLLRWAVATGVQRVLGGAFPWGVFAVNLAGCLLFGLVVALAEDKGWLGEHGRVVALTGFLGAFTTFSTFAFDNALLFRDGAWLPLAANLIGQNVLGVVCVLAGLRLGQAL